MSLPTHTLPTHVLLLIREYSKPMTRPDWRQSNHLLIHTGYFYMATSHKEIKKVNMYSDLIDIDYS